MAVRFIIEKGPEYVTKFEFVLNLLITVYSKSEKLYNDIYQDIIPSWFKKELYKLSITKKFNDTEFEDIVDLASEVYFYYPENNFKYKNITLRDPNELNEFEVSIDLLLELYNRSEYQFFLFFPNCPLVYYDKIDDLRETSIKRPRDSEQFIDCLKKSKFLAYTYDDLCDKYHNYKNIY